MKKIAQPQFKKLCQKYQISTLWLFGSQATGKTTKLSDYDFAVLFSEKVSTNDFGKLQVKILTDLLNLYKIKNADLVILNNKKLPLLLKYNIIKTGKILHEKNFDERVMVEAGILRRWLDWQYFEKLWGDMYVQKLVKGEIF
jgi:predicted nucleotidyltransferase